MNATNNAGQQGMVLEVQREDMKSGIEFQRDEYTAGAPSNESATEGGACPRPHAPPSSPERARSNPNQFPRGRWSSTVAALCPALPTLTPLAEAPLRELFWSPPETSMVEDATQRIAALLQTAANAMQEIQLFDDLYEVPAC